VALLARHRGLAAVRRARSPIGDGDAADVPQPMVMVGQRRVL